MQQSPVTFDTIIEHLTAQKTLMEQLQKENTQLGTENTQLTAANLKLQQQLEDVKRGVGILLRIENEYFGLVVDERMLVPGEKEVNIEKDH